MISINSPKLPISAIQSKNAESELWLAMCQNNQPEESKSKGKKSKNLNNLSYHRHIMLIQEAKPKLLLKLIQSEYVRKEEVAFVFGVSVTTLNNWAKQGKFLRSFYLKTIARPHGYYYRNTDLLDFLNKY